MLGSGPHTVSAELPPSRQTAPRSLIESIDYFCVVGEKGSVDLPQSPGRASGPDAENGLTELLIVFKVFPTG